MCCVLMKRYLRPRMPERSRRQNQHMWQAPWSDHPVAVIRGIEGLSLRYGAV